MWLAYFLTLYLIVLSIGYYSNYKPAQAGTELVIKRTSRDKHFLFFALAPLLFLVCFRGEGVGSDTPQYYSYFENIKALVGDDGMGAIVMTRLEPGFVYFIKVISLYFDTPQSLFIISALLFYIPFYRIIAKYSRYPWLSVIMFFSLNYNATMNVIRQYVAIGIIIIAFGFILKKQKTKFVLSVLLATMFHYTSIVFIVAYFFRDKMINKTVIKKFFIYLPIAAALSFALLTVVLNFFHSYGLYDYYDDQNKHIAGGLKIASFVELLLALVVVWVSCRAWGGSPNYENLNRDSVNRLLFWFGLIGAGFIAMSFPFTLISRMGTFFSIFNCILLPNSLYELSKRSSIRSLSVLLCLIYCSYYLVVATLRPDWTYVYPYSFCW